MLLKNCKIVLEKNIFDGDIRIDNGTIVEIGKKLSCSVQEEVFDAQNRYVTSGFVDIHTHGGYGADFMESDIDAFSKVLSFHADNGTTSVVATSCTAPKDNILSFLDYARKYLKKPIDGTAKVVGVHLEGPYLSKKNRGAQKLEDLACPSIDDYSYILEYSDIIKTVTIAPELADAAKMAKALTDCGIVVCGGHDDGIYPEFIPTIENGLTHLTHAYSAMSELRYIDGIRNLGLREYGLLNDSLTMEFIGDNRHIPPELALLIYKVKGAKGACVVSDTLSCAGQPADGTIYTLGSGDNPQKVEIRDGLAMLVGENKFAGSITPVRQMVKNLIDAGIPICDAVRMGTRTPAEIIGAQELGEIAVGRVADLCVLEKDFSVFAVFIDGKQKKYKYKEKDI